MHRKIPGSPIAYWISNNVREAFRREKLNSWAPCRKGMFTGNNSLFLKLWWEVDGSKRYFKPYSKGGAFRRWYGNREFVVCWLNEGNVIREYSGSGNIIPDMFYRKCVTWSLITSSKFSVRYLDETFITGDAGPVCYPDLQKLWYVLGFLNTKLADYFAQLLNPTLNFSNGVIGKLPLNDTMEGAIHISDIAKNCVGYSKWDWDAYETSWDFAGPPVLGKSGTEVQTNIGANEDEILCLCAFDPSSLSTSYYNYRTLCQRVTNKMKELEEENNHIFTKAYGLQDEIAANVPIEEITLFANPRYRYRGKLSEAELETRSKEDTMKELISYAVGCMMGRYSLDEPGLIYARSRNIGFDTSKYKTFPADSDGIIPITDAEWFDDDAALRLFRFMETAWAKDGLEDNLDFIADAIGRKTRESSRDAIRRYFVSDFFKGHLKTYKKRPIYWLFSSGKQKAFQALVYLHRYNEGTLSRMRTEYVLPLQSRLPRHIENLEKDREAELPASAKNKIRREIDKLRKQREELLRFDEKLRHYADMRIKLDLDDGVKVNYGKFGDLLAEVKAVTGKK